MQLSFVFRPPAVVCAGARATEDRLVAEVRALVEASRRDLSLLATPVRVIVPSKSLRRHVGAVLAARVGPHLLGVQVQTLHGLAQELRGGGDEEDGATILQDVFALRHAREEPALVPLLADYEGAEDALVSSVRQLLDAGLRAVHEEAAVEALAEAADLAVGERARAIAIVRAAARTEPIAESLALQTPVRVLEAATARLARPGPLVLSARAVLLHGFADATGVTADLLEELLKLPGSRLFVDLPPDPAEPHTIDATARFGQRLRERLTAEAAPSEWTAPPALDVFSAEGDEGEALEVTRRIAVLLAEGARPEGIGIVARDMDARAGVLRRHLDRLGVPYSALDLKGPPDTPAARWRGLVELVRLGPRATTDRWLELVGSLDGEALGPKVRAELRLALRALGAARLDQVARLDADRILRGDDGLRLPGGSGLDGPRVAHRVLDARFLRAALLAGRAFCAWWAGLPAHTRCGPAGEPDTWATLVDTLVRGLLGQPADHPVFAALAGLGALPPLTIDVEELRLVLADLLEGMGRGAFGGRGGGVQLLGVREARGRTFEHLYFLGNNRRNTNPRDAVLADPVRVALRAVLPDLPLRSDRFDEDRFVFAWMVSAAPHVTLSWQTIDARGKVASVSPLVERLRWAGRWTVAPQARSAYPIEPVAITTAMERATTAALRGGMDGLASFLPAAVRASRPTVVTELPLASPRAVAEGLVAVLRERDGGPQGERSGPYHGWIGPVGARAGGDEAPDARGPRRGQDPRGRALFVSVAEDLVACPWQALLQRFLGAEPVPDPLAAVPQADDRLTGILVHRVMERVLSESVLVNGGSVRDALKRTPEVVPWPAAGRLQTIAVIEAERLLEEEGVRLPGLARLLAIRVEPYLEAAREADWATGGPSAVGAEVSGFFQVGGRVVGFRADRADLDDGQLRLTDYKTGKAFSNARDPDTRREHLLERIRTGRSLQAAAYARAEGVDAVAGRYLFLGADVPFRKFWVHHDDDEVAEALDGVLGAVFTAMDHGVFFPRVVEPGRDMEPGRCKTCAVAEACVRGDSSDRGRIWTYAGDRRAAASAGGIGAVESAFVGLWNLPERK